MRNNTLCDTLIFCTYFDIAILTRLTGITMNTAPTSGCVSTCPLYTHCKISLPVERSFIDEAVAALTLDEIEKSSDTKDNSELDESYLEWMARLETRFESDPEGLARALKVIGNIYGSTLDSRESTMRIRREMLAGFSIDISRSSYREKLYQMFLDAADGVGCAGTSEKRVGFFRRKKIRVCSAPIDDEHKMLIAQTINTDSIFASHSYEGMSDRENINRLGRGEYGI